jgi:hypothetical protein
VIKPVRQLRARPPEQRRMSMAVRQAARMELADLAEAVAQW